MQCIQSTSQCPPLFRALHYGLHYSFPGSTSIQSPRWRLVSACSNSNKRTRLFRDLYTMQRPAKGWKVFQNHLQNCIVIPKLFYIYRASKYLPFCEKDEVNAVAPDEDTKHYGLALYPPCRRVQNQKKSSITQLLSYEGTC